jgi:predicted acylesterase/phospholipase RssA
MNSSKRIGIAVSSGTLKGVYGQGILSALEETGVGASAFACASSSVISAGLAAIKKSRSLGLDYWYYAAKESEGKNMSKVVKSTIAKYFPLLTDGLFTDGAPRFLIAASLVNNESAASVTQSSKARNCGRKLLIDLHRGNSTWIDENLTKVLFDTEGSTGPVLTRDNLADVAYASSRMLHAWEDPAEVASQPYVDASYTCSCPALELVSLGYDPLIIIDVETGPIYTSLTKKVRVEANAIGPFCFEVKPKYDLSDVGVTYLSATKEGIGRVYNDAFEQGLEFVAQLRERGVI